MTRIVAFTLRIKPKVFEMPVLFKQNAPIIKDLEIRQLQNNSCNVEITGRENSSLKMQV